MSKPTGYSNEANLLYTLIQEVKKLQKISSKGSASGVVETPTSVKYTVNYTVPAGAKSVTIITDATFAGSILGNADVTVDGVYTFTASQSNTLAAIPITCTLGSFIVDKIV